MCAHGVCRRPAMETAPQKADRETGRFWRGRGAWGIVSLLAQNLTSGVATRLESELASIADGLEGGLVPAAWIAERDDDSLIAWRTTAADETTVVVNAAQLAPQALAYLGECVEGVLLATKSLSPLILASLQTCLADHFDVEHSTFQLEPADHVEHDIDTDAIDDVPGFFRPHMLSLSKPWLPNLTQHTYSSRSK